jgi:hypothetical protein
MKMNAQHNAPGQNFQGVQQLAALLVMVLAIGSPCRAQSGTPSNAAQAARPAMSATPAAGTAVAQAATLPAIAPQADMPTPPAKAGQEGVKVHGHWIIDIRNADGTLDKHLDFENGLCTASSVPPGIQGGDALLTSLLLGRYITGPWQIVLASPTIPPFLAGATPGPACDNTLPNVSNAFVLDQNNATALINASCNGNPLCFPVLSAPAATQSQNGMILATQFTIPSGTSNTTITAVQTSVGYCLPHSGSTCAGEPPEVSPFSGTYLTGIGSVPPAPTVTAGQTVAISVQYSFQ